MLLVFKKQDYLIHNFTIYGERHSGTNLLESVVNKTLSLNITWEFGWKHFFGFTDYKKIAESKNTLFLCITRDPYDWIMAMYKKQYHIPIKNQQPIDNFIFNEWFSIDDYRKEIQHDISYVLNERYKNIFDMRKNKLQYFINYMPIISNNLCITTYEHLISNTIPLIKTIGKVFRLKANFENMPKIWNKNQYELPMNIKSAIDSNIDWQTEDYFGYSTLQNIKAT